MPGGIAIVPGSHRLGLLHDEAHEFRIPRETILDGDWRSTDFRAGDVLMFHYMTVHSALPNESDEIRTSIDIRAVPTHSPQPITGSVERIDGTNVVILTEKGERVTIRVDEETFNRAALGEELAGIFAARAADAWEADLTARGIGCVRADAASHLRFLHSDPQPAAIGFMTRAASPEFADQTPGGFYWRHAPTVKFSDTPCIAGLPYEGQGAHTREVMSALGYTELEILRLAQDKVIALLHLAVMTDGG